MKNATMKLRLAAACATLTTAVGLCLAASAATYKVDIDRPNGIYKCGETATFTARLLSTNGLAAGRKPRATLDNFGKSVLTNMPFDVNTTGVVLKVSGTLREPGFLRLSLPATKERADPFVFSVGFEPDLMDWKFWQYSDKGTLTGYDGDEEHIDLNVYNGTAEDFSREFAKPSNKAEKSSADTERKANK